MPNYPTMKRWMAFIDGENFTIRAQDLIKERSFILNPAEKPRFWRENTFIWLPGHHGTQRIVSSRHQLEYSANRAYYYTSLVGDDQAMQQVQSQLWDLAFTPRVFKRIKGREKSKGVDVTLSKDMLAHAFQDHYDVAVLFAGDGDYVPLVEEVKHAGKRVVLAFFSENEGLSPALKISADEYFNITEMFFAQWK